MKSERDLVLKYSLLNAVEHSGRAKATAVLGKVIAEEPKLKGKIGSVKELVQETIIGINQLSVREQQEKLQTLFPEVLEEEEEEVVEKELPALPVAEKYEEIVMRFAPNPSGPLHIGHARAAVLNHEYVKKYDGRLILRFEDTDPKRVDIQAYDMIKDDLNWLNVEWQEEHYQSDRLDMYYAVTEKLLDEGNAYVCVCPSNKFRAFRDEGKPCPCRDVDGKERWRGMLAGKYRGGEAIVRIKTDLTHPDPAVRDWPALRIVEEKHPRTEIERNVWPLMNFAVAVDDHAMGITHVLRGKDHITNTKRQKYIFDYLGWDIPQYIHYGTLSVEGTPLSTSEIHQGIASGEFTGWSDPRLATLRALRRRGIFPNAIREIIRDVGSKEVDVELHWKNLYAENKRIIDPLANRYYFVPNPVKLIVKKPRIPETVEIDLHPDYPERGRRKINLTKRDRDLIFYVDRSDIVNRKEGEKIRLLELLNVDISDISEKEIVGGYAGRELLPEIDKVQWVSLDNCSVDVEMPDGSKISGYGEANVERLEKGTVIQFVRFGFVRIDRINKKVYTYFTHT